MPAALAASRPEPIELDAKASTKIASTFCTAKLLIAALAWSALAWVSITLTSQPAAFAALVAPPITSMLSASLASSATMPSVFASACHSVSIATPSTARDQRTIAPDESRFIWSSHSGHSVVWDVADVRL